MAGAPTMLVTETGEELMRIDEPPHSEAILLPAEKKIERLKEAKGVLEKELQNPKGLQENREKVRNSIDKIEERIKEIRRGNIYTQGQNGVLDEC